MSDQASKLKGLAWILGAIALGALLAFGLSPLAHAIPWRWEQKLGTVLNADAGESCHSTPQTKALLDRLVARIYPIFPDDNAFNIEVHIVKNELVNAYAGLGGQITVYSGLLKQAQSPEELAGVLAHETEHVHHRHILEGMLANLLTSQSLSMIFTGDTSSVDWANYFLRMSFTREQESQADEGGLKRLQQAHIDNHGFRAFFERMENSDLAPGFLSDHPANSERIGMVNRFTNRDVTSIMNVEEWKVLKNICGE